MFSEFSEFFVFLSQKHHITGSISCGFSCTVWNKSYLKTYNPWNLIRQFRIPSSVRIVLSSQTYKVLLTSFRTEIKLMFHGQNVIETVEFFYQKNRFVIIGNFRPESKANIRTNPMNVRKLMTVINIGV